MTYIERIITKICIDLSLIEVINTSLIPLHNERATDGHSVVH